MTALDREGRRPDRRPIDLEYDDPFHEEHRSFSDRVERLLSQLVVLGLVALVLVQTLHTNTHLRRMLSFVDRMEGVDWATVLERPRAVQSPPTPEQAALAVATPQVATGITVVLVTRRSAPEVKLLVNGRPAGDFANGSVSSRVSPGSSVAIDGRAIAEPLRFRVVAAPGLSEPSWGREVVTEGNLKPLGTARPGR